MGIVFLGANIARSFNPRSKYYTNYQIRAFEVYLIGEEGKPLGVKKLQEALGLAQESGLDLVEIGPTANPPVCKITDYGKFIYEQEKKQKSKKSKAGEIKEIRFSTNTDTHDFNTKIERAKEFIAKGYKIRVTVIMSGRENAYGNIALDQMNKVRDSLEMDYEQRPQRFGNRFISTLIKRKQNAENQNE